MAWVEVELDDRTYRSLAARAEREGISVPELMRRIAARDARRKENGKRFLSVGAFGGDRSESSRSLHPASHPGFEL